jgi:hypothetical protein
MTQNFPKKKIIFITPPIARRWCAPRLTMSAALY